LTKIRIPKRKAEAFIVKAGSKKDKEFPKFMVKGRTRFIGLGRFKSIKMKG